MNGSGNKNRKNDNNGKNNSNNPRPRGTAPGRGQKPAINAFLPDETPKGKPKKRGLSGGAFLALVLIVCVAIGAVSVGVYAVLHGAGEETDIFNTGTALITGVGELPSVPPIQKIPAVILGDETECQNALLVNVTTVAVIAEKNPDEIVYPASLTKIMTALVAIENIPDLESKVVIDRDMVAYIKANKDDIVLIDSPVGLKGQAIRNQLTEKIARGEARPKACDKCLKRCSKTFCIMVALNNAQQGNIEEGLIFSGANVGYIKEIIPAAEVIKKLVSEFE